MINCNPAATRSIYELSREAPKKYHTYVYKAPQSWYKFILTKFFVHMLQHYKTLSATFNFSKSIFFCFLSLLSLQMSKIIVKTHMNIVFPSAQLMNALEHAKSINHPFNRLLLSELTLQGLKSELGWWLFKSIRVT